MAATCYCIRSTCVRFCVHQTLRWLPAWRQLSHSHLCRRRLTLRFGGRQRSRGEGEGVVCRSHRRHFSLRTQQETQNFLRRNFRFIPKYWAAPSFFQVPEGNCGHNELQKNEMRILFHRRARETVILLCSRP